MVGRMVLFGGRPNLFLGVWLILWVFGGGMAIAQLAWMCFGIEVIEVDRKQLSVVKKALFYKSSREYDVKDIRNIRVVEYDTVGHGRNRRDRRYSIRGGLINFDYGMKTIKFGVNIDPAEANHLISEHFSWINSNNVI